MNEYFSINEKLHFRLDKFGEFTTEHIELKILEITHLSLCMYTSVIPLYKTKNQCYQLYISLCKEIEKYTYFKESYSLDGIGFNLQGNLSLQRVENTVLDQ